MSTNLVHVSTADAKERLSNLINQVSYGRRRVVITSRGKPKVAMVTLDDLEQIGVTRSMLEPKKQRRLNALEQAAQIRGQIAKSGKKKHDPVDSINRVRLERDKQLINNLR